MNSPMTTRSLALLLAAGALCLSGPARADDDPNHPSKALDEGTRFNSPARDRDAKGHVQANIDQEANRSVNASHVGKINKATGILGMKVMNQQDEKLGEIRDLVMDLESGNISYAVLAMGGFVGIGSKLIAVPVDAFSISPSQDALVLNASKAKLEAMPGLTQNDWPTLNDPQIAAHWRMDNTDALGTSGPATEIRGAHNEGSTAVSREDTHSETRDQANNKVFSGRIVTVDPEKRLFRVESENGDTKEFSLAQKPKLVVGGSNHNVHLVDFKVGYNVNVGFHEENGAYVAHSLIRTDAPATRSN